MSTDTLSKEIGGWQATVTNIKARLAVGRTSRGRETVGAEASDGWPRAPSFWWFGGREEASMQDGDMELDEKRCGATGMALLT